MPDDRIALEKKFWQWMKEKYATGKTEASVKGIDLTPFWEYFWATQLSPDERKLADERSNEEKSKERYLEYQKAGGFLDFTEWLDSGEITIEEEQAAIDFINRALPWGEYQVNREFFSDKHRKAAIEDIRDRLFGQNLYYGARQTISELPSQIINAVGNYWASIPVAEQKRIEAEQKRIEAEQKRWEATQQAEQKQLQQQAQDITQQRQWLPLGAGGTKEQQVNIAYQAIQKLKTQMQTAPDYLKNEMGAQISQLESAISQTVEQIRGQARRNTEEELYPKGWREEIPGQAAEWFGEKYGVSPERVGGLAAQYMGNPDAEMFSELTLEEKQDLASVGLSVSGRPPRPPTPESYNPPGFEDIDVKGPERWKSWFQSRYPTIAREFMGKGEAEWTGDISSGKWETPRTKETWADFLQKERERLKSEYYKKSPYERGERPEAFAPRIRTVKF